jgi:hypothetical protein
VAFTYDVTTDRGKVRLLVDDRDTVTAANQFFNDAEIDAFLALQSGGILRAAAMALESMAASEVMVQKRITILDLSTDGPGEAAALRALADSLREQAEVGDGTDPGFDIAEMVTNDFSWRERWLAQALRDDL